jgi:hypothetical protein
MDISKGAAVLAVEVMPCAIAAITAYGTAVLANSEDTASDLTIQLGRRLLQQIFGTGHADRRWLGRRIDDLAANPGDEYAAAEMRRAIHRALRSDAELATAVRVMITIARPVPRSRSIDAYRSDGTPRFGGQYDLVGQSGAVGSRSGVAEATTSVSDRAVQTNRRGGI